MILVIISDVTEGRKYHGMNQHHIADDETRRLSPTATDPTTYYQIKANYYRTKAKKSKETTQDGCYRGGQCDSDDNLCCDCTIDEITCIMGGHSSGYWSTGCVDICKSSKSSGGTDAPTGSPTTNSNSSKSSSSSSSSKSTKATGAPTGSPALDTKTWGASDRY